METVTVNKGKASKWDKSDVIDKIKDVFRTEGKWIPKSQVAKRIGVPRSTLIGMGIDPDSIAKEFGYERTRINPKGSLEERQEFINRIVDRYKQMILEAGRPVKLYQLGVAIGLSETELSRIYRYGIDWEKIHEDCGIKWHLNSQLPCKEDVENQLRLLISERQRYVTRDELAEVLEVSGSSLSFHKVGIEEINLEFGFTPLWRSFEMYVGEIFKELYPDVTLELQKTFDNCCSNPEDKRTKLKFDFYCPEMNLLIEVDGPSHWNPNSFWYDDEVVRRDRFKDEYAQRSGISLIRVRYRPGLKRSDIEEILSGIPLKLSVGQPAAKPEVPQEGSETIPEGSRGQAAPKCEAPLN